MNSNQNKTSVDENICHIGNASHKELLASALYDFANSGYTTVVQTTIFSAYFVSVVAGATQVLRPVYRPCFGRWLLALPIL